MLLLVNQGYFYFCTLKVSALSVSRHGSSLEFYVTKPFDEKICLSQCLLISVSGQKAKKFFRTRKMMKGYFSFLLQSFGLALWHSMAWRTIIAGLYYVLHFKVFLFHLFVVFREKKKQREAEQVQASGTAPSRPTTRMDQERADKRRETVQQSVRKHGRSSPCRRNDGSMKKEWPITTE